MLITDNGGEYTSNSFKEFYADVRIKRELTILYNPQQNGVFETKKKVVIWEAKVMLHDQDLPMFMIGRN